MSENSVYRKLLAKIEISAKLKLLTGMHIGSSDDFSPIGAVDKYVVRDILTMRPMIPGTSMKGKIRFLLARAITERGFVTTIDEENVILKRLFGSKPNDKNDVGMYPARLQFWDNLMDDESVDLLERANTDLYLTEIKYENAIDRITSVANPRQIERVPAGSSFDIRINYNLENEREAVEDLKTLIRGFKLLEADYLGGHGSRGYGRVRFEKASLELLWKQDGFEDKIITCLKDLVVKELGK